MTMGNHDLNYGVARLQQLNEDYLPILTGNLVDQNGDSALPGSITKEVEGITVGVFGVYDDSLISSADANALEGHTVTDAVAYANQTAQALTDAGCDVVVCLTHSADPIAFAQQTFNIDLVVSGHQHLEYSTLLDNAQGKNVFVTQNGYYFWQAGLISLSYDPATDEITQADLEYITAQQAAAEYTPDETVSALIDTITKENSTILNTVIGASRWRCPMLGKTSAVGKPTSANLSPLPIWKPPGRTWPLKMPAASAAACPRETCSTATSSAFPPTVTWW